MRLTLPVSHLLRRITMAFIGQLLFSFGNFLTVKADIGQAPWNAFQLGLGNALHMTYGQATILVAFTVVAVDLLLREPIGLGTLMSALMVGGFYDFFDNLGLFPVIETVFTAYPVTWFIAATILTVYLLKADWLHNFDRLSSSHT